MLIDVVEAGAERVDPPCPVADACGGCQWQHLDYPAQVRAKAHIVRDALERIGGLTDIGDVPIESSPEAFGYRGRARVRVERGRPGFRAARDTSIRHTNLRHPEPKTARGLQDTPTAFQEAFMTAQEASKTA